MSEDKSKQQSNSENKPTSERKKSNSSGWIDKVKNIGDSLIERRAAEIKPRPTKTGGEKKPENDG